MDSFTAKHRQHTTHHQSADSSIDHNALSLLAEINPGRTIRIYAKTNRRIRIEVIHNLGRDGFRLENGGRTADSWEKLPQMLEQLAEDATPLVNLMLAHFRRRSDVTPSHIPAYQLLLEICENARHFPTAVTIASTLIHNGCIAAGGAGERM